MFNDIYLYIIYWEEDACEYGFTVVLTQMNYRIQKFVVISKYGIIEDVSKSLLVTLW